MMKLCCLSLSYPKAFRSGEMDIKAFVETCRALDLDGIDLHASSLTSSEKAYLKEVKRLCLDRGLPIACLSVSNDFGRPEGELQGQIDMVKRWTDAALFLGAPVVRVFAGWVRGEEEEAVWERTVRGLKAVAAYGEEVGVVIGLQNHNHHCVTRTGDDVLRLVQETGSSYLAHVWDTGQYAGSPGASGAAEKGTSDTFYHSLEQTAHLAVHVRAKIYRVETGVEAWLDYPRIFNILKGAGYNGFVSVVYEGVEDERQAIPKAVRYLRSVMGVDGKTS